MHQVLLLRWGPTEIKQPQPLGGLSRFRDSNPCKSAAFLRMLARLIASVRSGPGAIFLAASNAARASISRSRFGRGFLTGRDTVLGFWLMVDFGFAGWGRTRCGIPLPRPFRPGVNPARSIGFEGVARLDPDFGVRTFRAFVGTVLETFGPR